MKVEIGIVEAKTLETMTSGPHGVNLNCLREYLWNSVDDNPQNVGIHFENNDSDQVVRDDGGGNRQDPAETSFECCSVR